MHEAGDQYEYAGTFSNDEIAKMEAFLRTLTGEYKGKSLAQLTAKDNQ